MKNPTLNDRHLAAGFVALISSLVGIGSLVGGIPAYSQVLLSDDFNSGTQVNPLEWRVPFPGDGSFLGQTQLNTDNTSLPSIVGGAAVLELSTFLDGSVFSGSEMITKRNFALGGGLVWKARMKINSTTPNGVVGSGFLFDVSRETPPGTPVRDEIDLELLSNEANGDNRVLTNTWNDEDFINGAGDSAFVPAMVPPPSPYDLNVFHDYEIRWTPGKVQWFIDHASVRTVTSAEVPNDPMKSRFNIWVPDSGFTSAYDPSLLPAANAGANKTYTMEVDSVSVERINTTTGPNLLVNGSFEDISSGSPGNWSQFNNAFDDDVESSGVLPEDGSFSMKTFGPFKFDANGAASDASGAFQTVTSGILPGKEYSASVFAWSDSVDTIFDRDNFAEIVLAFEDSNGTTIDERTTPIYDGRDGLLTTAGVQDQWNKFTVEGLAPAGTTQATVSLFFIQVNSDDPANPGTNIFRNSGNGAIWFDDASLVQLNSFAAADFNQDGRVDELDLGIWDNAFGNNANADADNDSDSDGNDFLIWQQQFTGPPSVATASSFSVPEPIALELAVLGCCVMILPRPVTPRPRRRNR